MLVLQKKLDVQKKNDYVKNKKRVKLRLQDSKKNKPVRLNALAVNNYAVNKRK